MTNLLKGWRSNRREDISPWAGLAFVALYLGAISAVGIAAYHIQNDQLSTKHVEDAQRWTRWLARHLAHVEAAGPQELTREILQAARENGIGSCAIVASNGTYKTHSRPSLIGQVAREPIWSETPPGRIRIGRTDDERNAPIVACRIASPLGKITTDELRVELADVALPWRDSDLLFWCGYVLIVALGLYLLAYRLFRRQIQPLAVIREKLVGCGAEVRENLSSLRLNDSFDQMSSSWNQLIEFVSEMEEQVRHVRLTSNVGSAMDSYRSERLSNILMEIPFGVLAMDAAGEISFANRAVTGLLTEAGHSLENTRAVDVFGEELLQAFQSTQNANRPGPAGRWIDHTFERAHGKISLRFWPAALDGASGGTSGDRILFVQDVTQAKEAEQARDQFLYHVTHELRTPLTNIRAYAETLSEGVIDDEQTIRECYNVIMGETHRLNTLVEDILSVSQLEVGSARLNIAAVSIDELLRKVVQNMQGNADAKNIDLVLGIPAKVPKIRGDRDRLAVVLTNLVGNAIKYTPANGRVDVTCAVENERVRITITNSGIGIAPEDQEKIFEKFYRVDDESVAQEPGTGLGLAIVKETVRLHGGAVMVESEPGKGSTFALLLPSIPLDQSGTADSPLNPLSGGNV